MKSSIRKDYIWNTLGSLAYAAASVVLAFLAMRVLGAADGGVFGFGFSTFGQQMFIIAYFGIRPFHITDVRPEYPFSVYRSLRVRTTLLAAAVAVLWLSLLLAAGTYTARKALCILFLAGWKIADGYADVYECECQRLGVLWRAGRELFLRTLAAVVVFSVCCLLTKDLFLSALSALLSQIAAVLLFRKALQKDYPESFRIDSIPGFFVLSPAEKALAAGTVLLFAGVFLDFYIVSSAKYAIDLRLDDQASGIFNILFMPANVIYMAANFVMKPSISRMAESLEKGNENAFARQKKNLLRLVGALSAAALSGTVFLGKWALSVGEAVLGEGYAGRLTAHAGELTLIIAGGCLYAFANLYYYCLVIRRRQKGIFFTYLAVTAVSAAASFLLVGRSGLTGAAMCYAISVSLVLLGFYLQERNCDNRNV